MSVAVDNAIGVDDVIEILQGSQTGGRQYCCTDIVVDIVVVET